MSAVDRLLSLTCADLVVRKTASGKLYVFYENGFIKEGIALVAVSGDGETFEEACEAYYNAISGKTLVLMLPSGRKEITVL